MRRRIITLVLLVGCGVTLWVVHYLVSTAAYIDDVDDWTAAPGETAVSPWRVGATDLGEFGAIIFSYDEKAALVNLAAPNSTSLGPPFPEPTLTIYLMVGPPTPTGAGLDVTLEVEQHSEIWWQPRSKLLGVKVGCLTRVHHFGTPDHEPDFFFVPPHSAYISRTDLASLGFHGCTAVILSNGEWVAFAHCLNAETEEEAIQQDFQPIWITTGRVFDLLEPALAELGEGWQAYLAGAENSIRALEEQCRSRSIEVCQTQTIDASGHDVYFDRQSQTMRVEHSQSR
jgi:hypothetical protein